MTVEQFIEMPIYWIIGVVCAITLLIVNNYFNDEKGIESDAIVIMIAILMVPLWLLFVYMAIMAIPLFTVVFGLAWLLNKIRTR